MPKISQGVVNNTFFPVPPIAKQQIIVERLEKLFAIVDELEKQVSERKEKADKLMLTLLKEVYEGQG